MSEMIIVFCWKINERNDCLVPVVRDCMSVVSCGQDFFYSPLRYPKCFNQNKLLYKQYLNRMSAGGLNLKVHVIILCSGSVYSIFIFKRPLTKIQTYLFDFFFFL